MKTKKNKIRINPRKTSLNQIQILLRKARARGGNNHAKGKSNGLKDAYIRAKQALARDERRIAEAERRNQKGGANVVRMLSDRRRK
jgi:hypothetical protein